MRTCIACAKFWIDEGYCYSTMTAANTEIHCRAGHFSYKPESAIPEISLSFARTCPDFELSDLARSKGWTDADCGKPEAK